MYLIVGLGNPEEEYSNTRHNMGFNTINKLSEKYNIDVKKKNFKALYGIGEIEGKKVVLLKPQTYMNLSGESIIECMQFYKITVNNVIIIYDDIDVKPEAIKIRKKGGPGGHNGMKSVIQKLGTEYFCRIRVGIGAPEDKHEIIKYVIGNVSKDDILKLDKGTDIATEAVVEILLKGIDSAMNKFN